MFVVVALGAAGEFSSQVVAEGVNQFPNGMSTFVPTVLMG